MKGETRAWFQVAFHLRLPVAELKDRISYREFIDWLTFLQLEEERQTKQDYYLAQVAAEIRRGHVKNPKTVKTKDFLLEMKRQTEGQQQAEKSKSVWMGVLKIKEKEKD